MVYHFKRRICGVAIDDEVLNGGMVLLLDALYRAGDERGGVVCNSDDCEFYRLFCLDNLRMYLVFRVLDVYYREV